MDSGNSSKDNVPIDPLAPGSGNSNKDSDDESIDSELDSDTISPRCVNKKKKKRQEETTHSFSEDEQSKKMPLKESDKVKKIDNC